MLLLPIEGIRKGMEPCNKGRSPYNGRLSDFSFYMYHTSIVLIAKYLFTGSLKNRSIDNLETQKK